MKTIKTIINKKIMNKLNQMIGSKNNFELEF